MFNTLKKLTFIAGLLLATNGLAHDELFPACPSPHKAHQVETEGTIKPPDIKGLTTDLDSAFALLEQLNQFDPNVILLQGYVINALGGAYLDKRDDYKAVLLLRHFLEKTWNNKLVNPKQGYLANVNLGIAAFNLGDFCVSYHSFDRAVNAGSKLKIKNKKLIEYRDLAKEKI